MKERLPKLSGHLRVASGAILGAMMALALVATWAGVGRAQSPGTSSEPGFIKNLHITGFAQNTSATWIESNNIANSVRLDRCRQRGSVGLAEQKFARG